MKKLILFIGVLGLGIITSCSSDDNGNIDPRDAYVGTWDYTSTGSFSLFYFGDVIGTAPINDRGTVYISKSGENELIIDDKKFTLNGTSLTSNPESISQNEGGMNMVGTAIYTGQVGTDIITINTEMSGSWSTNDGLSGEFSGTSVTTFTRP